MTSFRGRGVIVDRKHFSLRETVDLIARLGRWNATLFAWDCLAWAEAHEPIDDDLWSEYLTIRTACAEAGLTLWVGLKPGDRRWCCHRSDRQRFLDNARRFLDANAGGIYLLMDDMHTANVPSLQDDEPRFHAQLISELADIAPDRLPAVCAQQYAGRKLEPAEYWQPILGALPVHTAITWTGHQIRSWRLDLNSFPEVDRPLVLWDNSLVMYDKERAPGPYPARRPELTERLPAVIVNVGRPAGWQLAAIRTAMRCLAATETYQPLEEYRLAILELATEILHARASDELALRDAAGLIGNWVVPAGSGES